MLGPRAIAVLALLTSSTASAGFTEVAQTVGLADYCEEGRGAVWVDLNGDGFLDLVVNTGSVSKGTDLFLSDGAMPDPSFSDQGALVAPGLSIGGAWRSALVADIDHDGDLDLVRDLWTRIEVWQAVPGPGNSIWGNGTSASYFYSASSHPNEMMNVEGMAFIDYDDDGYYDLIADNGPDGFYVLHNDFGSGSGFSYDASVLPQTSAAGTQGDNLVVADLDLDGDVDLVARRENGPDLYWNDGGGTFTVDTNLSLGIAGTPGGIVACDLDNDVDLDLYWTDANYGLGVPAPNQVLRNDNGVFTTVVPTQSADIGLQGVACGDLDNDGDFDLVAARNSDDLVLWNDSPPSLDLTPDFTQFAATKANGATLADYDRDGDLDVLFTTDANDLELWRNDANDGGADQYLMVRVLHDRRPGCSAQPEVHDDLGAVVWVVDATTHQPITGAQSVGSGSGFGDQGPTLLHFGLPASHPPTTELIVEIQFQQGPKVLGKVPVRPSDLGAYQLVEISDWDLDGDGIPTEVEWTLASIWGNTDADADGWPSWSDPDSDGDGLPDREDLGGKEPCAAPADTDTDGIPDLFDPDSDDDGVIDGDEIDLGIDPLAWDSDDDGVSDGDEVYVYGSDPRNPDTDGDGIADGVETRGPDDLPNTGDETDPADRDTDDDGLSDSEETEGPVATDPTKFDTDGDHLGDGQEQGEVFGVDGGQSTPSNVPIYGTDFAVFVPDSHPESTTDPLNLDSDGDGIKDGKEDVDRNGTFDGNRDGTAWDETDPNDWDTDDDLISDKDEGGPGPTGPDDDEDGVIDALDTDPIAADRDGDGLLDRDETEIYGTDPDDKDSDDDGLTDRADLAGPDGLIGTADDFDPLDADVDDDGLSDGDELWGPDGAPGTGDETDPLIWDTDGDGLSDGLERGVFEPLFDGFSDVDSVPYAATDTDRFVRDADGGATTTNPTRADTDGDGLSDGDEDLDRDGAFAGDQEGLDRDETDPNLADTDGDGYDDSEEGGTGPGAWDSDGDTIIDPLDPDEASTLIGGGGCACDGSGSFRGLIWLLAAVCTVGRRRG